MLPELRLIVIDNSGGGIFHFLPQEEAMPEDGVRGPARDAGRA